MPAPLEPRKDDQVSLEEIAAEGATALPDKEVMSLLNVDADVDLGIDLAAPVDLAAAANLNVAAPIEAAASANLLSPDAQSVALAQQTGSIDQTISGSADALAQQDASIAQGETATTGTEPAAAPTADGGATAVPTTTDAGAVAGGTADAVGGVVDDVTDGTTGEVVGGTTGEVVDGATGAVDGAVDGVTGATDGITGGVSSLLSGGSLLDANVNVDASADLTAPVAGAVAANANVAAPIDAAVSANIGSEGAISQAAAIQDVQISQQLDGVTADAEADQDADVTQ